MDSENKNPLILTREFLMTKKRQELIEQYPNLDKGEIEHLVNEFIKTTKLIDLPFKTDITDEN